MGKRNKFKCIYGLFAPNNKVYIGQTTDPINRKSRYKTLTCNKPWNKGKVGAQKAWNKGLKKQDYATR